MHYQSSRTIHILTLRIQYLINDTTTPRRHGQCQGRRGCRATKAEGGAERHKAPGQLGPAAACRPIRTSPPSSAAPAAAAAPCAPSRGHNKVRRRLSESHRQHRAAAPRLREHSPVPLRALPGRAQSGRYLNLSSEPARGSLLPPPPPPARGAAAPSSLVFSFTVLSVLTGGFIWPNWLDDAAPKIDRRRPGWVLVGPRACPPVRHACKRK